LVAEPAQLQMMIARIGATVAIGVLPAIEATDVVAAERFSPRSQPLPGAAANEATAWP